MKTPEVSLHKQVYGGSNGTRIYYANGQYHAVDGTIDLSSPHAYKDLLDAQYFRDPDVNAVLHHVTKGDDRF